MTFFFWFQFLIRSPALRSFHVSLTLFQAVTVPQSFLVFHKLDSLNTIGQVPQFWCVWYFLMIMIKRWIFDRDITEILCPSLESHHGIYHVIDPINGKLILIHWWKWCLLSFYAIKSLFSLCINIYVEDYFETMQILSLAH